MRVIVRKGERHALTEAGKEVKRTVGRGAILSDKDGASRGAQERGLLKSQLTTIRHAVVAVRRSCCLSVRHRRHAAAHSSNSPIWC